MALCAGFELETRPADWQGAPFTAESRSHVSVYQLTRIRGAMAFGPVRSAGR